MTAANWGTLVPAAAAFLTAAAAYLHSLATRRQLRSHRESHPPA